MLYFFLFTRCRHLTRSFLQRGTGSYHQLDKLLSAHLSNCERMKPAINARLLWPTLVNLRRKKADPLHQIVANEIFHATLRPIMSGRELNQFSKLNGSLGHFIYEVSFDSV
jgi:hypothetical protein